LIIIIIDIVANTKRSFATVRFAERSKILAGYRSEKLFELSD